MSNSNRIIIDVILFASVLFFPWFVPCIIAVIACWFYDYYEIIFLGFLIDVFYDSRYYFHIGEYYIPYSFTLIAFFTLFALRKLKKRVRFSA